MYPTTQTGYVPCNSCPGGGSTYTPSACPTQACGTKKCSGSCDIPHTVVDKVSELAGLCNVFVTVREENAVYHIDGMGNPVAVSRNPVFENSHSPVTGLYKATIVYDFTANKQYVYDYTGAYRQVVGGLI